jgi:hypothetical protein
LRWRADPDAPRTDFAQPPVSPMKEAKIMMDRHAKAWHAPRPVFPETEDSPC